MLWTDLCFFNNTLNTGFGVALLCIYFSKELPGERYFHPSIADDGFKLQNVKAQGHRVNEFPRPGF